MTEMLKYVSSFLSSHLHLTILSWQGHKLMGQVSSIYTYKIEAFATSTILHISTNFLINFLTLFLSCRLPDKFFSCSFFSSLNSGLLPFFFFSMSKSSPLLSFYISSLLLSTMIKIKILPLKKKKKLLHSSTYHYETQNGFEV